MADISTTTRDSTGQPHLLNNSILSIQFVEVDKSEFSNPSSGFSGYAADGFYYTRGEPDPTVTTFKATWAQEGEHSESTVTRGVVDRFPDRIFVVCTESEVVILSADSLDVWIRFTQGSTPTSSPTGKALGGSGEKLVSAKFSEGVLFVATSKGVRYVDFVQDCARYITSSVSYYGIGLRKRNSDDFYTVSEFSPSSPDLRRVWDTISTDTSYTAGSSLIFHLPMEEGSWEDSGDNDLDATGAYHSSYSSPPSSATDSPLGFTDAPTTCISFSNEEDAESGFEAQFAYIPKDAGDLLSFPSNAPFSFSAWIKPDPDEGTWADRSRPYHLFSKQIQASTMGSRFDISADAVEYEIYILSAGELGITLYADNDPSHYVTASTRIFAATGSDRTIPDPEDDVWTHIAITYDGTDTFTAGASDAHENSGIRFFVNGVLVNDANYSCSNSNYTSTSGGPWTYMTISDSPFFIGNSGRDTGGGNAWNRGQYFDGKMCHAACWSSALNDEDILALYRSASEGVYPSTEDPPFLTDDICTTLSSAYSNDRVMASVGHPIGMTAIVKEIGDYPRAVNHPFQDTYSTSWIIRTANPARIEATGGGTDFIGEGWKKGDTVYLAAASKSYEIDSVANDRIELTSNVSDDVSLPITGSTFRVDRPINQLLLHGDTLYYVHGLSKVSVNTGDWVDAPIDAFAAVTGTVSFPGVDSITEMAYVNGDIYIGTDIGVLYVSSETFEAAAQGATLQYSSAVGDGRYQVIHGEDDGCTSVGVDPETGHLLVANTDSSGNSSVTEIDLSIHQAFQFFDENSTPAVTEPVTTMVTYRNVNGPPDVEVS